MAWMNRTLRQRLVGALVLTALAVIFLPMLFSRTEQQPQLEVKVPPMPDAPAMPEIHLEPTAVPEPPPPLSVEPDAQGQIPAVADADAPSVDEGGQTAPAEPVAVTEPAKESAPAAPAAAEKSPALPPAKPSVVAAMPASNPASSTPPSNRLDTAGLPVSWCVQLASLKNHDNAQKLRDDLRRKGYNAYIRAEDGMSKVLVGPLIQRTAATRLRDELKSKQQLEGFLVRFQP